MKHYTEKQQMIIDTVNGRSGDGSLRSALERYNHISPKQVDSVVHQALSSRYVRGVAVGLGYVREALENAGWTEEEIDYLLYKSKSTIFDLTPPQKGARKV